MKIYYIVKGGRRVSRHWTVQSAQEALRDAWQQDRTGAKLWIDTDDYTNTLYAVGTLVLTVGIAVMLSWRG